MLWTPSSVLRRDSTLLQQPVNPSQDQVQQLQLQLQLMQQKVQEMQKAQQTQQQSYGALNFNPVNSKCLLLLSRKKLQFLQANVLLLKSESRCSYHLNATSCSGCRLLIALQQSLSMDSARYYKDLWQDLRNQNHEAEVARRQQQINQLMQSRHLWLPR